MSAERLFFALWPPAAVRDALVAERAACSGTPGRLSHPLDLHLTLVFIGNVDATLLPCIEMAADDVVEAPFRLPLDQLRQWPEQHLWLAQPVDTPVLFHLVSQLQQNLLACGLPPESRRYRPHITLARKAPPMPPRALALNWQVQDFVLAASAPNRTPSYRILRSWPLLG
jgi:RNA 2',3'-cyclic 3'-phosphodiesterase